MMLTFVAIITNLDVDDTSDYVNTYVINVSGEWNVTTPQYLIKGTSDKIFVIRDSNIVDANVTSSICHIYNSNDTDNISLSVVTGEWDVIKRDNVNLTFGYTSDNRYFEISHNSTNTIIIDNKGDVCIKNTIYYISHYTLDPSFIKIMQHVVITICLFVILLIIVWLLLIVISKYYKRRYKTREVILNQSDVELISG